MGDAHQTDFYGSRISDDTMNSERNESSTDSESDAPSTADQVDLDSSDFDVSDTEPTDEDHRIRIHVNGDADQVDHAKEANNNNIEEYTSKTILTIAGVTQSATNTDDGLHQSSVEVKQDSTGHHLRTPQTTIVQINGATQDATKTDHLRGDEYSDDDEDLVDDESAVIVNFLGKANELVGPSYT